MTRVKNTTQGKQAISILTPAQFSAAFPSLASAGGEDERGILLFNQTLLDGDAAVAAAAAAAAAAAQPTNGTLAGGKRGFATGQVQHLFLE